MCCHARCSPSSAPPAAVVELQRLPDTLEASVAVPACTAARSASELDNPCDSTLRRTYVYAKPKEKSTTPLKNAFPVKNQDTRGRRSQLLRALPVAVVVVVAQAVLRLRRRHELENRQGEPAGRIDALIRANWGACSVLRCPLTRGWNLDGVSPGEADGQAPGGVSRGNGSPP